ncbi:isopentenyl-diphosphate delta-isomerase [Nannochloropsis oceanica]
MALILLLARTSEALISTATRSAPCIHAFVLPRRTTSVRCISISDTIERSTDVRLFSTTNFLQRPRGSASSSSSRAATTSATAFDPEQARLFEEERIIAVTFDDKPIKAISKRNGHRNQKGPPLHRAFSVFLFDTLGRLLLQKRAAAKITFPSTWTNTCCSHPLWTQAELGDDVQPNDPVLGCKRAAIRKLEQELGIPSSSLAPSDFTYMNRIHYISDSNPEWGEHEIDYIFLVRKDVELNPNLNEVSETRYVDPRELRGMIRRAEINRGVSREYLLAEEAAAGTQRVGGRGEGKVGEKRTEEEEVGPVQFTPWCRAIMEKWLFVWWSDVGEDAKALEKHRDVKRIFRIGRVDP